MGKCTEKQQGANKNLHFGLATGPPTTQKCEHCDGHFAVSFISDYDRFYAHAHRQVAGPMWNGPLHDTDFVDKVLHNLPNVKLGTADRIAGMLTVARHVRLLTSARLLSSAITDAHCPYRSWKRHFTLRQLELHLASTQHVFLSSRWPRHWSMAVIKSLAHMLAPAASRQMRRISSSSTLCGNGLNRILSRWTTSRNTAQRECFWQSHLSKSLAFIIVVARCNTGISDPSLPRSEIDLSYNQAADKAMLANVKLVRYQQNPTANWGPQAKAGRNTAKKAKLEAAGST